MVVLGLFSWILVTKDPETPVGETLKNFLPFGSGDDFSPSNGNGFFGGEDVGEEFLDGDSQALAEILFRVTDTPTAGFVALNRGTSSTVVRYTERATGHIYDVNLETLEKTRLTNQTLPKIYEAYFRADGSVALFRSLKDDSDTIENILVSFTPPRAIATTSPDSSFYTASSTILRGDIGSVVAGSGNTLFYVLRDAGSIVSATFDGSNQRTLFSSQFTDWILSPYGNNGLLVYTKAGSGIPGYAYALSASGGLTKLLGPLPELTAAMSYDGGKILYSQRDNTGLRLFINNILNNTVSEIASPSIAEKCVWSKVNLATVFCGVPSGGIGANELNDWYSGKTFFRDRIWSFDAGTELANLLAEPVRILGFDLDVFKPKLSPREDYLVFMNKNDLSIWALKLEVLEE